MNQLSLNTIYYLQDEEIKIIEDFYPFNMALAIFLNSSEEFIVDTNFITSSPVIDEYIKINLLR